GYPATPGTVAPVGQSALRGIEQVPDPFCLRRAERVSCSTVLVNETRRFGKGITPFYPAGAGSFSFTGTGSLAFSLDLPPVFSASFSAAAFSAAAFSAAALLIRFVRLSLRMGWMLARRAS